MPSSCKEISAQLLPLPNPLFPQAVRSPSVDDREAADRAPAASAGAALAQCLQESECVMIQRHTAAECLRSPLAETLPIKCKQLRKGYGECRRGMIDMRKRFRGNQPVSFGDLQESDTTGQGYQLYAGKSAFGGTRGETAGDGQAPRDWREVENEEYRNEKAENNTEGRRAS